MLRLKRDRIRSDASAASFLEASGETVFET